jgi:hypothetical protein
MLLLVARILPFALSLLSLTKAAQAAEPDIAECLAASAASIEAGNVKRRRAERAELLVCARPTCPGEVRAECLRRIEDVNRRIPTLVFDVRAPNGEAISVARIRMDEETLTDVIDGSALPVDPGRHRFSIEVTAFPTVLEELDVRESEKGRRVFVQLREAVPIVKKEAPPPASGLPAQKVLALSFGAVGLAGVIAGSAFGFTAQSRKEDAEALCPDTCATDSGVDAWDDALGAGNLSTLFFAIGGAGLATGAILWLTTPVAETGAQLGLGVGRIQFRAAF